MLTLNTGQTPMSTRHQLEMLYSDYKNGVEGLTFISEAENRVASGEDEFKFSDVLDGFLSYVTGDYYPTERDDLIAIIKNLESITKEDKQKDVFKLLITGYNLFRLKMVDLANNWSFIDEANNITKPFASNINGLFSKVQLIAAFGSACSFLIKNGIVENLEKIHSIIPNLLQDDVESGLDKMIRNLDNIRINAKKIGNEQRMYFFYFVRSLFNSNNDGYLNVGKSVDQAFQFYKSNAL
jgi:hypothetical protein